MSIVTGIVRIVLGPLFDTVESIFNKYVNKQISFEEARRDMEIARTNAEVSIEVELTKRIEAWQETLRASPILQRLLSVVVVTQLCVLLFYQLVTPAILFAFGWPFPTPHLQLEWAYLLVGGALMIKTATR